MVGYDELNDLYENVLVKNVKRVKKLYDLERNKAQSLLYACQEIKYNLPHPIKYNVFFIKEPKYRLIMSLSLVDKLINHYIAINYLQKNLEKYLIDNNVATRKGMGTSKGIKMVKEYIEENKKYGEFYILKIDISKYFYNIDHEVLKSLLKDKLSDNEYTSLERIIDSTDESYINEYIDKLKKKFNYSKEVEEIPYYVNGKGLPIGNMTSQFLSIFYLYKLDHFIVHDLHLKYYCRYMDDFIIIHHDKKVLQDALKVIEEKLENEYKLKINEKKTKILKSSKGFTFLGYNFKVIAKKTIVKVNASAFNKIKVNVKEKYNGYETFKYDFETLFCSYMTYYKSYIASKEKIRRYLEGNVLYKEQVYFFEKTL